MSMFRALAFLEVNYARNNLRAIVRAPQRLAIWIPTSIALFVLYAYRIDRPGAHAHVAQVHHVTSVAAAAQGTADAVAAALGNVLDDVGLRAVASSTIAYLLVAMAAIAAALALGGRTAVFRSSAEAVLFSNVGMPPLLVALWLQGRKLLSSFRVLTVALYVFVFVTPAHANAGTAARGLGLALLSFAIPTCIQLPAFLLRRTPVADALQGVMWALAALATAGGAAELLGGDTARAWLASAHVDPAPFALRLTSGDPLATFAIAAVVLALCASIAILGRDAIPDFYRVTTQGMVKRSARPDARAAAYDLRITRWTMPDGPFAYVWKDWIAFRRGRGKFTLWLATLSFWCIVGTLTALTRSQQALGVLAFTSLMFLIGVAPVTAGEDLANDLSKPLFWLARDSVFVRIAAITFGRAARTGLALGVAPLCAAALDGNLMLAGAALPLAIVFAWALQAMGTALYAYFPADVDQRGPIVYLRLVLGVILLLPVPFTSAVGYYYFDALGSIVAALVTAGAEGALALWIASERFERRGGSVYGRFGVRG